MMLAALVTFAEWLHVDALRWFNLVASCLVVVLLTAGAITRWHLFTPRMKRIVPWVVLTYAILAYGSGEALQQELPPALRVYMLSVNLVGLLIALVYRFDDAEARDRR